MNVNNVMLYGNLTRDPELKSLPSGMAVCNFGIATNRTYKNAEGVKTEAADFHNIVAFGKQAESVHQFLKKGSSAFIEGRLQSRSWETKEGDKRYTVEVVANSIQFGPRKKEGEQKETTISTDEQDITPEIVDEF